jgi:ribosomal protein S18 acetylase RimI-like enzyme
MPFRLREGSSQDLPALATLDSSFSNEWLLFLERSGGPAEQTISLRWCRLRPAGSRRRLPQDADHLTGQLQRSERLIIAEAEGRTAGYLMLGANWNRTADLVDIIVDAAYRRQGLGRRFLQEAESFARERHLRALQWETQNDNREAIEFALSRGYRIAGFHDTLYENRGAERQDAPDFPGLALILTRELD